MAFLPPADISTAYNLLAIIADPAKTKKALKDLEALSSDVQKQFEEVTKGAQELEAKKRDFDSISDVLYAKVDEQKRSLENKEVSIKIAADTMAEREQKLTDRETALSFKENQLNALKTSVEQKVAQLNQFEYSLSQQSRDLNAKDEELTKRENLLTSKFSRLKDLM